MLETVEAVIEALGGNAATASLLGVRQSAVSNWKVRGQVPSHRYFAIAAALRSVNKEVSPVVFGSPASHEETAV